ncbi:hypothetical protein J4727_20520 [Providencia rettgeri]|uniref:Uncharacterized protein n=1 Tax=Providencia rettgeri TaxID=587 RepID=A0A939NCE7_PRORE|nr:hypothetical protein [Providencia rettgeri]
MVVWVRRFRRGFAPNETRSLGSLAIAGRVISFRSFFPFFAGRSSDKNKSLPPSFYSVGQIASCHKTSL